MRLSFMKRLLLALFIALGVSLLFFSWQVMRDWQSSAMSLTQVVEAQAPSSVPELSNIELSNCTLHPSFAPAITSYTCTVPYNITFITFTVTADSPNELVTIYPVTIIWDGPVGFSLYQVGARTLFIEVSNQETTITYQVTVTRLPSMLYLPLVYSE